MGRTTEYVHDFDNRLIEVDYAGMVAQYKYDPFGRRIEKNVNGDITRYFYDGADIVTEFDGNWNVKSKYTQSLIIDDPLAVEQGTSTFYYYKDGLGSVVDLTDSGGSVVKSYTYKSFGEIYSETGSLVQPFTFTGREYDPESGLYYYRARYYDPRAGRFLTKDPIGFAGGDVNLYRAMGNNPINFIDPFGLYESPWYLMWVPGQHFYDLGRTSLENRNYGLAGLYFAGMAGEQALFALTLGQSTAAQAASCEVNTARNAAKGSERITKEIIERGTPGRDGGQSRHIIEKLDNETISVTQQVERSGKIIHQHQKHIGRYGTERFFPDQWIEYPQIPPQ